MPTSLFFFSDAIIADRDRTANVRPESGEWEISVDGSRYVALRCVWLRCSGLEGNFRLQLWSTATFYVFLSSTEGHKWTQQKVNS